MIEEKVFEEHPFWEGGGLVLCEPYPFIRSIHSAKRMFFYSSFSSYHPGAKLVERHGILNEFRPPNSRDDLCLFFCTDPSSMMEGHCKSKFMKHDTYGCLYCLILPLFYVNIYLCTPCTPFCCWPREKIYLYLRP